MFFHDVCRSLPMTRVGEYIRIGALLLFNTLLYLEIYFEKKRLTQSVLFPRAIDRVRMHVSHLSLVSPYGRSAQTFLFIFELL